MTRYRPPEKNLPIELNPAVETASFTYFGRNFKIIKREFLDQDTKDSSRPIIQFEVEDSDGVKHGEIIGEFRPDSMIGQKTFHSDSLTNTRFRSMKKEKIPGHVPNIVRETIVQLLDQGQVDQWVSTDYVLLEGGMRTYEALLKDQRLIGTKIKLSEPDSEGDDRYQYILTKRKS